MWSRKVFVAPLALAGMAATAAQAQPVPPVPPPGSWQAVTQQVMLPQWTYRPGESWSSFRNPLTNFYVTLGGHAGISRDSALNQVGTVGCPAGVEVYGCDPFVPSAGLGTGGGGSFGIGARLTPVIRTALMLTAEGGYNQTTFVESPLADARVQVGLRVRSFQASANLYADLGGILGTGRWNPYVMGGVGVAVNQTGDATVGFGPVGGPITTSTTPGGTGLTQTSFLWTAGGGVQYQLTPSSTIEVFYQYVDAGSFQVNPNGNRSLVLEGDLRTHRIGAALSINFSYLAQLVAGR